MVSHWLLLCNLHSINSAKNVSCDVLVLWCVSGWVRFMLLGLLASTCCASSAPCTISVGLWWPPMCPTRGSSRPPSPTTSTWVCCSSSSSSVCYLSSTPSWPCHLHLTVDPSGDGAHMQKHLSLTNGRVMGASWDENGKKSTIACRHVDACSGKDKMFDVIMETIDLDLPAFMGTIFSYAANPGLIIPAVLLMVWVYSTSRLHSDRHNQSNTCMCVTQMRWCFCSHWKTVSPVTSPRQSGHLLSELGV